MQYADRTKLRAYFFGNMYLSQIQQGIQAAHVVTKLFANYGRDSDGVAADVLYDWADEGVTKILLNGGYQSNLAIIYEALGHLCNFLELPYAQFYEEDAALNGALTSVGVVVPHEVYGYMDEWAALKTHPLFGADAETVLLSWKDHLSEGKFGDETAKEHLYFLLKSCRLA